MASKNLVPWKKMRFPLESMRGLVEPLERFFETPLRNFRGLQEMPEVDVKETPKEIIILARLPGMTQDDIRVDVTENTVSIAACKTSSEEQRKHGMLRRQEASQSFERRFTLPAPIKTGDAKAQFKDGVLKLHLPRVKETQVRRVDID